MIRRVQHPKIDECRDREKPYYFFRYWHDEVLPDGAIKTSRKRHICGPMKGKDAITKRRAEEIRNEFLAGLNVTAPTSAPAHPEQPPQATTLAAIQPSMFIFGKLAGMWRNDYVEKQIGDKHLVATPTREKYRINLENHILPRWKDARLGELHPKAIIDWLTTTCTSWHHMNDLRGIMSGIVTKAIEWQILPREYANPMKFVKLPKKWEVREKRILTDEETARVLAHLEEPNLLICETCLDTGTRISEVTGLIIRHVDVEKSTLRIAQRNWRGDIDGPKTDKSKRTLALGALASRYALWIAKLKHKGPDAWVFPQDGDHTQPRWDSGVRQALKRAATLEGLDFEGFGPHSLRRSNITIRQEVGGSSIEASRIAGHATTKMTEEYTVVQLRRQEELTRRIQDRRAKATKKAKGRNVVEIGAKGAAA